eukprot:MONOS_3062.1-p1 / transcript=MONOS_3062.1 / gene=MONOS_3062 / organism=Monocercomonoides_exilis_PA203 / gene_product=integral membrane protein, putative / transcript_product=integral membrane protein, putative / location=Mono_scaffold00068:88169-89492(-) / protein_length=343 / sequence_SO=supercontig / SO=protein_coding / is_pseudo=false
MMTVFVPESFRKLYVLRKKKSERIDEYESEPLIAKEKKRDWTWLKVFVPSICDTVATVMMNAALVVINVSIWQMLRGSIIIFTAILTIFYRKRKLYPQQWLGMCLVFTALIILGATALLSGGAKGVTFGRLIVGVILVVLAQAIQAFQTIVEEQLLHDSTTPPMAIVAWEGFWGFCTCTFLCMPIVYFVRTTPGDGLQEDIADTFVMMANSPVIIVFALAFVCSILLFNIFGMFITEVTSALTRNVLEPMRTMLVWITSIILYYASKEKDRETSGGEPWSNWSYMQLGGFVVMTVGVMTYNFVWKFPCWRSPQDDEKAKAAEEASEIEASDGNGLEYSKDLQE